MLLSSVILALHHWTNRSAFKLSLEGHGREGVLDGIDVSRTVGWFTAIYPLLIKLNADLPDSEEGMVHVLKQQKIYWDAYRTKDSATVSLNIWHRLTKRHQFHTRARNQLQLFGAIWKRQPSWSTWRRRLLILSAGCREWYQHNMESWTVTGYQCNRCRRENDCQYDLWHYPFSAQNHRTA